MKINLSVEMHNKYRIVTEDFSTGEITEAEAYNIVLNNFPAWCATDVSGASLLGIAFGSGTGTLDPTRTTMFTRIGGKLYTLNSQTVTEDSDDLIYTKEVSIVLLPSEYVGQTFREVGLARDASNTTIYTQALIEDSEGNPISIGPKTDTQQITIYATFYWRLVGFNTDAITSILGKTYLEADTYLSRLIYLLRDSKAQEMTSAAVYGYAGKARCAGYHKVLEPTVDMHMGATTTQKTFPARTKTGSTLVFNPVRWEGADANGEISEIGIGGSSNGKGILRLALELLPSNIWDGVQKTGEVVGTGDGVTKNYNLAWRDPQNLVVKVDGVTMTEGVEYIAYPLVNNTLAHYRHFLKHPTKPIDGLIKEISGISSANEISYPAVSFISRVSQGTAGINVTNGGYIVYDLGENKKWAFGSVGFGTVSGWTNATVQISDDGVNWTTVMANKARGATLTFDTIPTTAFRYIKTSFVGNGEIRVVNFTTAKNQIEFVSAPANNAVITADFKLKYVPKDSDHMFDVGFTFNFGADNPA